MKLWKGGPVARIFQGGGGGGHSRDTIRGLLTTCIYGLHRCFPLCISGLSRIIAALRPILTKDKSHWRKYFTKKTNFKKVGFSTMAFTAKILSWRFRHLNIVRCLLKRRPARGGGVTGTPGPPLPTPLLWSLRRLWKACAPVNKELARLTYLAINAAVTRRLLVNTTGRCIS